MKTPSILFNSMLSILNTFNGDLSAWNVTSVTDMSLMFCAASAFNGELSTWAASEATYIGGYMFSECPLANDMKPARCRN